MITKLTLFLSSVNLFLDVLCRCCSCFYFSCSNRNIQPQAIMWSHSKNSFMFFIKTKHVRLNFSTDSHHLILNLIALISSEFCNNFTFFFIDLYQFLFFLFFLSNSTKMRFNWCLYIIKFILSLYSCLTTNHTLNNSSYFSFWNICFWSNMFFIINRC